MATMTILEAEKVVDIVANALEATGHRHRPVSALQGYDIYQICTALKLRLANEFLLSAHRDDFEQQFSDGLRLYDSTPWHVINGFVPDDQVDVIGAKRVFDPIDPSTMSLSDERLAAEETASSFGEYCKSIGTKDDLYWQKVYTRLRLEYTPTSPKGNDPVFAEESNPTGRGLANAPFDYSSSYMWSALLAALMGTVFTAFFAGLGAVLSAFVNWTLSIAKASFSVHPALMAVLVLPLFVRTILAMSTPQKEPPRPLGTYDSWAISVYLSFGIIGFAFVLRAFKVLRLSYIILLSATFFVFCYSEMFARNRRAHKSQT